VPEVLIVAGEPSGDALAAELVEAAREIAPGVRFFGATGPELERAGAERVVATSELAVMGLVEVVRHLPAIRRLMGRLEAAATARRPAGAILVDSPDFNLRLAARLRRRGVPVVQYVSPTVWAWRAGRVATLERNVRRLLLTLPFEPAIYAGTGVDAVYVGHPAADRIPRPPAPRAAVAARWRLPVDAPWVALVPGSRAGELDRMGPLLAAVAGRIRSAVPDAAFLAPIAPGVPTEAVLDALAGGPPVTAVDRDRFHALAHAAAAVVTSGTASLELALLGVPHAVAYRMATASYWAARALLQVEHIALPNLIAGRRVVPEFIQSAATPDAVAGPVITWLSDPAAAADARAALAAVESAVGRPGTARRAAVAALDALGLASEGGEPAVDPAGV
jgi:lipid-A-disaccharide synthase